MAPTPNVTLLKGAGGGDGHAGASKSGPLTVENALLSPGVRVVPAAGSDWGDGGSVNDGGGGEGVQYDDNNYSYGVRDMQLARRIQVCGVPCCV